MLIRSLIQSPNLFVSLALSHCLSASLYISVDVLNCNLFLLYRISHRFTDIIQCVCAQCSFIFANVQTGPFALLLLLLLLACLSRVCLWTEYPHANVEVCCFCILCVCIKIRWSCCDFRHFSTRENAHEKLINCW